MPENWKTYKLGELTIWKSGGTPSKSKPEYWGGEIPWISAKSLKGRYVYDSDLKVTKAGLKKGTKLAIKGSILLLVRGSGLYNDIPVAMASKDVSYNQDVKCVLPSSNLLSNEFLLYWFKGNKQTLSNLLEATSIGAGKFDMDRLLNLKFKLPPLPEQKSIASILSALDDKIELNLRMNKTLEEMAMALYKHWFVDFGPFQDGEFVESKLGEIPKGWEVKKLEDLLEIKYGKDHKKLEEGKIPVYGSGGIMRYVDTFLYDQESILIPRKGTLSNLFYLSEPFWSVDTMFYSKFRKQNFGKYIFYFLKSLDLASMDVGSAVPSLTTELLNRIKILVPAIQEVEKFNEIVSSYFEVMEGNKDENKTLTQLRDTLLPKLISGEVRVQDAEKTLSEVL